MTGTAYRGNDDEASESPRRPETRSRLKSAVKTILTAAVLGPPLAGVMALLLRLALMGHTEPITTKAMAFFLSLPISAFLGYWDFGLYAIAYGVILTLFGWQLGRLPVWAAFLIPAAFSVPLQGPLDSVMLGRFLGGLILWLVPALVVWWPARGFWKRVEE